MTIGLVLTIVFVILKVTHTIAWSWWWVVSPSIIETGLEILWWIAILTGAGVVLKKSLR